MSNNTLTTSAMTFKIVELLRKEGPMTVTEISDRLDIHQSSTCQHLNTLGELDYVRQSGTDYKLGLQFLQVYRSIMSNNYEYYISEKYTEDLATATGYRSIFAVRQNYRAFVISRAVATDIDPPMGDVGSKDVLHTTAMGKVLLANTSDEFVRELTDNPGLIQKTEHTITSVDELLVEIDDVREDGYAFCDEENTNGIVAVAVPVSTADGRFLGALALNAPATDVEKAAFESRMARKMKTYAAEFAAEYESQPAV